MHRNTRLRAALMRQLLVSSDQADEALVAYRTAQDFALRTPAGGFIEFYSHSRLGSEISEAVLERHERHAFAGGLMTAGVDR